MAIDTHLSHVYGSFNSLYEIPEMQREVEDEAMRRAFQFSLWDSIKRLLDPETKIEEGLSILSMRFRSYARLRKSLQRYPFNSLYEIPLLLTSSGHIDSSLSILSMRFLEHGLCSSGCVSWFHFQFSLWDSWRGKGWRLGSYPPLSILSMRFICRIILMLSGVRMWLSILSMRFCGL